MECFAQLNKAGGPESGRTGGGETQPGQQKEAAMTETTPSPLNNVITIDDERIKSHLDSVVRGSALERDVARVSRGMRLHDTRSRLPLGSLTLADAPLIAAENLFKQPGPPLTARRRRSARNCDFNHCPCSTRQMVAVPHS